jgi:hypothetical protein
LNGGLPHRQSPVEMRVERPYSPPALRSRSRNQAEDANLRNARVMRLLIVLLSLTGCADYASSLDTLTNLYQQSIIAAAIKRPDYARPLQPIDISRSEVTVAHVQPYPSIDNSRFIWVTFPDALRELCRGRPDPLLAIQQALGLPPKKHDGIRVFTFDVRPADMFRPCASSPEITTTHCTVDLSQFAPLTGTQTVAEHFVLKQMMDSYRGDFESPGYPFTAMGWTFNWDPEAPTHQGVSEYVVKPGAVISNVVSVDPATFCRVQ